MTTPIRMHPLLASPAAALFVALAFSGGNAQIPEPGPTDPIDFIRSSFETVPIVALAEGGHAARQPHLLFQRLFSDPTLLASMDVIIVEFANGRHQEALDAYIQGEDVPFDALSRVWRDTGQSPSAPWDSPLYEELLRVIRETNMKLPPMDRVRVLAGDPPVDWDSIQTREGFRAAMVHRDPYVAELATEQAFQLSKKVLILFGGVHLPKPPQGPDDPRNSLTYRILAQHPGSVRAIGFLNPENLGIEDRISEFTEGAVYPMADHWVGDLGAGAFFPGVFAPVVDPETGRQEMQPLQIYADYQVRDLFDALVYIGPSREWEVVGPTFDPERDAAYLDELDRRSLLRFGRPYRSGG